MLISSKYVLLLLLWSLFPWDTITILNNLFSISVEHCGTHPVVPNGVVVQTHRTSLKYQCSNFYTLVGSETVMCYNDGTWSQIPVCKGMNKSIWLLFISKSLSKILPQQLSMSYFLLMLCRCILCHRSCSICWEKFSTFWRCICEGRRGEARWL